MVKSNINTTDIENSVLYSSDQKIHKWDVTPEEKPKSTGVKWTEAKENA